MKKIAVVMGGYSAEKVVSMKSGAVAMQHVASKEYHPYAVVIDEAGWRLELEGTDYPIDKSDFSATVKGEKIHFDAVFMAIHGTPGEDGELQGYLDRLQIPYTTSGAAAAALSFNKGLCNDFLRSKGISCAAAQLLQQGDAINEAAILAKVGLPCFVKPNKNGSSFGVSKVNKAEELAAAIQKAFVHDDEILVESFMQGTEVTCGVLNFGGELRSLPATEIVSENDFFDYEAKYEGKSQEITPARLSAEVAQKVSERTKEIYQLLKLDGIARIDFIIQDGEPYIIEANTVPGLSEESIIPQQAACAGISLSELFQQAVRHALNQ
jgi:D-alanine-D-alanine ligase